MPSKNKTGQLNILYNRTTVVKWKYDKLPIKNMLKDDELAPRRHRCDL